MNRRVVLQSLGLLAGAGLMLQVEESSGSLFRSPVKTNHLRPPGAVNEELFGGTCIRCGRCVEVCPYRCITLLDIRQGVYAGTPLIDVQNIPCYLCMKCIEVCPSGALQKVSQQATRMGTAIINKFTCAAWSGVALCRTCYDKCPFKEKAIFLDELKPVVVDDACTGCGLCTYACPITTVDGLKAINIDPSVQGAQPR